MKYLFLISGLMILTASADQKPNIIFFLADDQRDDVLGCAGNPIIQSPTLDDLAAQGVRFDNAFCQVPICAASRATLLSGLTQRTHGYNFGELPVPEKYTATSYPMMLKKAGYRIGFAGKYGTRFEGKGLSKGFDFMREIRQPFLKKQKDGTVRHEQLDYHTASWAVEQLQNPPKQPFFMTVGFFRPHVPLYASQKWFDLYPEESLLLPPIRRDDRKDTPRFSWYIHWKLPEPRLKSIEQHGLLASKVRAYLACVSFMDAQVGRVLDALDSSGLRDNTIVVCWSDHGYHLGEKEITGKNTLWDPSTRVPLMFAGPGIAAGGQCERPAELLDIYPTLAELCDLKSAPAELEGLSLVPQLKDAGAPRTRRRSPRMALVTIVFALRIIATSAMQTVPKNSMISRPTPKNIPISLQIRKLYN